MVGVDIGSNSLRAVRIECETLRILERFEWIVRTAEELESSAKISEAAKRKIEAALCDIRSRYPDESIKAVATAAFRKAKNTRQILDEIERACGVKIEVVTSEMESFYSVKGVEFGLRRLGIAREKFLLVDIGGGSTEIILKYRDELVMQSFDIGILTTIQKYRNKEEILHGIRKKMQEVREFCRDIYEYFGKPKLFVGTGGTPTTVAALKIGLDYESYDPLRVDGVVIDSQDITKAYRRLLALSPKERAKLVGVGREDAVMAGLVILEELLRACAYPSMMVMDEGVREGVAIELCEKIGYNSSRI